MPFALCDECLLEFLEVSHIHRHSQRLNIDFISDKRRYKLAGFMLIFYPSYMTMDPFKICI